MNTRTNKVARIAAILTTPDNFGRPYVEGVAINRGEREGVAKGMLYFALDANEIGDEVALFRVTQVREKMSIAKVLWVDTNPPLMRYGWYVYLYDRVK